MRFPSSVSEYKNILTQYPEAHFLDVEFQCASKIIFDFIKRDRFTITRGRRVKKLFLELFNEGVIPRVSVGFFKNSEQKAYMTDDGRVYFSKRLLHRASTKKFVTIMTHELAHVILSSYNGYDSLLLLDREFLKEHESCVVISPVELYATSICISILEGAISLLGNNKRNNGLAKLVECEREQVIQAKKSIGI